MAPPRQTTLNELLLKLNFKIPELRNPKFLDGLPSANKTVVAAALSDGKRRELLTQLQKLGGLRRSRVDTPLKNF